MAKSKFPAKFLSASDIGKRIKVWAKDGAVIEDVLTGIKAGSQVIHHSTPVSSETRVVHKTELTLVFQGVASRDRNGGYFEIGLEDWVKRCD